MKTNVLALGLVLVLGGAAFAQDAGVKSSKSAKSDNSVSKTGKTISIESGTQIAAQLQNSLNIEKAKVGDQVVLKTTQAVKQNGETVIAKGSKLIGRVSEVQARTKEAAMSKVGIVFDRLQQDGSSMPIQATIVSVTRASTNTAPGDDLQSDISGSGSTSASARSSGGGGLLGGVGSTVGGVVNTTTQTVGGVANTVGSTAGSATGTVGGTLRGIQISNSTDASASGGSTLSLAGGNLKLDQGTTFNLSISSSASADSSNMKKPGN